MTNLREHKSQFAKLPKPKILDRRPDCLYGSFKTNLPPKSKSQAKSKAKPPYHDPAANKLKQNGAQQSLFKHKKMSADFARQNN